MRNLLRWLGAVIQAQPLYADEITAVRLALQTCRASLPYLERLLP